MSLVLSLIDAYLLRHPEDYCQWVRSYLQWRWDPKRQRMWSTRIGGHYRRAACYASVRLARGGDARPRLSTPTPNLTHASCAIAQSHQVRSHRAASNAFAARRRVLDNDVGNEQ